MSEYNYNENYFNVIDDEHKAYWLGFLYADGYVEPIYRKNKIKAFRIEIGLCESDKEHLQNFLNDISSDVPISIRTQVLNSKKYTTCRARVNNTKICRDLIRLGCTPQKSLTLEFPNKDIVSTEFLRHFIRGYFDGDGCVSYTERSYIDKRNGKRYTQKNIITSFVGTNSFLTSLISLLSSYNILFKIQNKSNCGNASEIRTTRHNDILNFYHFIYDDATIFLERKFQKFNLAFSKLNITP